MKLISNFTDYYEASGLAFGIDDKLVYVRKTKEISSDILTYQEIKVLTEYSNLMPKSGYLTGFNVDKIIIGFCGKIYPAWNLYYLYNNKYNSFYFTNSNQLIDYFLKNNLTEWLKEFTKSQETKWKGTYSLPIRQWAVDYWVSNFSGIEINQNIFFKLKTPVFSCVPSWLYVHNLTINPNLKKLNFQHIVDPLTAFQEVSMYLGAINSQGENKDYSVGGDKIIAEQKGFDEKSFTQVTPTKKDK